MIRSYAHHGARDADHYNYRCLASWGKGFWMIAMLFVHFTLRMGVG